MGLGADRLGQEPALVVAHVPRRRTDEARHGVPLLVLAHVEAQQGDRERFGELARELGLAHARGPDEEQRRHGLSPARRSRPAISGWPSPPSSTAVVLPEDLRLDRRLEAPQALALARGDARLGERGRCGRPPSRRPRPPRRPAEAAPGRRARRASRPPSAAPPPYTFTQAPASSITSIALSGRCRSLMNRAARSRGRLQRLVGVAHPVVALVALAQPEQDPVGFLGRGLAAPRSSGTGARGPGPCRRTSGSPRAWWSRCSAPLPRRAAA